LFDWSLFNNEGLLLVRLPV
jgi:hypothetical protein